MYIFAPARGPTTGACLYTVVAVCWSFYFNMEEEGNGVTS